MSRLTLRLPVTLHQQLAKVAESEGISLNQYIVYALTRQTCSNSNPLELTSGSMIAHSSEEIEQQQISFQLLKDSLPKASTADIEAILAERQLVDCEPELTHDIINRLREKIAAARH